jgi:hypothetical protein
MFELNAEFIKSNLLNESLCIIYFSFWYYGCFYIIKYAYTKLCVNSLVNSSNELNKKQDILFDAIQKLKIIVDIDKKTTNRLLSEFNKLKIQMDNVEKILSNLNKATKNSNDDIKNNRNHITFPHFAIFDTTNYNQFTKTPGYKGLKDDTRLLSIQLAEFLDKPKGSCMTFDKVHIIFMENYIKMDTNLLWFDDKLKLLFGLPKDYNNTEVCYDKLEKYLEQHLRKIE